MWHCDVVPQDLLADAAAAAAQRSESSQGGGELFRWVEVDENAACGLCYTRYGAVAGGSCLTMASLLLSSNDVPPFVHECCCTARSIAPHQPACEASLHQLSCQMMLCPGNLCASCAVVPPAIPRECSTRTGPSSYTPCSSSR
jgi:hypothetical protein